VRSDRWTAATTAGFVLGGAALHSPGASGVGAAFLEWDVSAAIFGAVLGAIVGAITALLQSIALGRRDVRVFIAVIVTVSIAHALADGAPAIWGVSAVAAISGAVAAVANAWRTHSRDARLLVVVLLAWWSGWMGGVALAGALNLSFGSSPEVWAMEHVVIAAVLGLTFGAATSPAMRRILRSERALSSAG
jgi:hypothetical protein